MSDDHAQAPAGGLRVTASRPRRGSRSGQPQSRRWHRGPKGASLIDLIFKIRSEDGWSATLRNDPSVVLVAGTGDELAQLTRDLALAILQGHGTDALDAMRSAGSALPAARPEPPKPGSAPGTPGRQGRDATAGLPARQAS